MMKFQAILWGTSATSVMAHDGFHIHPHGLDSWVVLVCMAALVLFACVVRRK
ncbi:MAG: peptidase M23 [Rhodobacteraceae bacterium]|nr:peptidase M23 [Paracoccaceae bacterium]